MLERMGIRKPLWVIQQETTLESKREKKLQAAQHYREAASQTDRLSAADRNIRRALERESTAAGYKQTIDFIHFFWR